MRRVGLELSSKPIVEAASLLNLRTHLCLWVPHHLHGGGSKEWVCGGTGVLEWKASAQLTGLCV